jgi:hypothetical protein
MNNHTSLDERGNQLRLDLQELYSSVRRNKTVRVGINDIGDFIRGYIPVGISFEDAEHILRSAGFDVPERPGSNVPDAPHWPNRSDKYAVVAATLFPSGLMSRAELMLGLRPKSAGDYSTVKDVRAGIVVSFL